MKNIKPHCHIDCYCAVFVPGCLGPLWTETLAQVASVGKNTRVLMKHPWGECSKLLVDWVLGPMAGEMWVNRVAVVMIPVRPGTLTTATRVTQHTPTFGPRNLVHRESRHHPRGGVNRHLMLQPPKQPGPEFKFRLGPWHQRTTTTQILWSDGWAWLANRVGVMSTPGRTDMLKKPTRVTHQALVSDQGLNIVVVFAHLGPLQAEALQQLASVGKTSRFWV